MLVRRSLITLWAAAVCFLGTTACGAPDRQSETGAGVPAAATATSGAQSSAEGVVIDVTPMSATELAAQPIGQSEPGAGAVSGEPQAEPSTQPVSGTMLDYTDSTYTFRVAYPAGFVFRTQPAEKLAQLEPKPAAAFVFLNSTAVASDIPDQEPADLEIRVYATGRVASLESWLTANGLLPADGSAPPKPFQTANVSGVQVCAATMIAPGCSHFVLGSGRVYQLIPASVAGETMIQTFKMLV